MNRQTNKYPHSLLCDNFTADQLIKCTATIHKSMARIPKLQ